MSTLYELMRKSELYDDDGAELEDLHEAERQRKEPQTGKEFEQKYKEFYSDIKTNIREDW
ncbi:MAG: hypothetical protein J6R37_02440 [Clostridia bacterium]|nr:hypothetical protein [Clostridia bacterium]